MPKRKRKQRTILDHDQKRALARQVVAGRLIKQVAAEFNVSQDHARKVVHKYTVVFRTERYPLDDVQQPEYECTP